MDLNISNNINNVFSFNESMDKKSDINSYTFDEFMKDTINKVNDTQNESNDMTEKLISGEDVSMHEVMLKSQEAQMSMQLMIEFRNKIYDVYQELNKVQV